MLEKKLNLSHASKPDKYKNTNEGYMFQELSDEDVAFG